MGGGNSTERKASIKSDAVQDQMVQERNERSPSKQDVRSSVEAHADSIRRRSRSVASISNRNNPSSFRSGGAGDHPSGSGNAMDN